MVGHQRALLKIDGLPGQAQNLALPKTEDQHQDVCGVERIESERADSRKRLASSLVHGTSLRLRCLGICTS